MNNGCHTDHSRDNHSRTICDFGQYQKSIGTMKGLHAETLSDRGSSLCTAVQSVGVTRYAYAMLQTSPDGNQSLCTAGQSGEV